MNPSKPEIILVFRKPLPSTFSIEYLFHSLAADICVQLPLKEMELPYFSKGVLPRLANAISLLRLRGRIVHITGDCYYAILGAVGSKRIITIHDLSFLDRTSGWRRQILKLLWVKLPVLFSHRVTVVSRATYEALAREVPSCRDKTTVITNFIDPIYRPVLQRSFRAEQPRILQIGTAFNKNIPSLIQALSGIPCVLVIVGKMTPELEATLVSSGIVYEHLFRLSQEALYEQYRKADFLAFVSTVEGFGMPIPEAQATGLPVLTSECSSMPEVAGEGAILVNPHDVGSIRSGIQQMLQDENKRKEIVEKGYENVKRFSREQIAREYLALYGELSPKGGTR